jgi:hypothetical protein
LRKETTTSSPARSYSASTSTPAPKDRVCPAITSVAPTLS